MRILIDILHPAHVHFFKNFIWEMEKIGHEILVTARKKDVALELLNAYKIPYIKLSKSQPGRFGLFSELINRNLRFIKIARRFKPHFITGLMGATIGTTNPFLPSKAIVFWDTEISTLSNRIVYPLADYVCTPTCYRGRVKGNHITYAGYHELAHLHPKRFKPNPKALRDAGIKKSEPYFIVRFVSWISNHDFRDFGVLDKVSFVKKLEEYGRPLITSEAPLPQELEKYRIKVAPERLHDLMAFSSLCIGESPKIAAEAGVLGVPGIYISQTWRGYIEELQNKYRLVFHFNKEEDAMKKAIEILNTKNYKKEWQKKRERMLKDKIDVTAWMVGFFEGEYDKTYTAWHGV